MKKGCNDKTSLGCTTVGSNCLVNVPDLTKGCQMPAGMRPCNGVAPFGIKWCARKGGWPADSIVYTQCNWYWTPENTMEDPDKEGTSWVPFSVGRLFELMLESFACDNCPSLTGDIKKWIEDDCTTNVAMAGEVWCFDCGFACALEDDLIKSVTDKPAAWTPCMEPNDLLCRLLKFEKGPKGDTGPAGPKGDVGADGADGAKGDTGAAGAAGAAGATGPQGPKGDTGGSGGSDPDHITVTGDNKTGDFTYTLTDGTESAPFNIHPSEMWPTITMHHIPANSGDVASCLDAPQATLNGYTRGSGGWVRVGQEFTVPKTGRYLNDLRQQSEKATSALDGDKAKAGLTVNGAPTGGQTVQSGTDYDPAFGHPHESREKTKPRWIDLVAGDKVGIFTKPVGNAPNIVGMYVRLQFIASTGNMVV